MKWIIDRLENGFAAVELDNKEMINIPLNALPDGVREGDVISVCIDSKETQGRKEKIDGLMNSLFKD